jgi:outer membrane receptor protein involved in Fe transport
LVGTYVDENTFAPGAGGANGRGSIPDLMANFKATVGWRDWTASWMVRYIADMDDPDFDGNNPFGYSGPDSYDKHDLRVSYDWDQYGLMFGVNNVFDEDPPYVFNSGNNTDTFLYDVRGLYWFLQFDARL